MSTFLLFGTYGSDSIKNISAKRTDQAAALIKSLGGRLTAGYALLGQPDLVLVVDLPDNERAMRASASLSRTTGIAFRTAPAVDIKVFDRLMKKK
jgi:uncharacterized protein with GYD domain